MRIDHSMNLKSNGSPHVICWQLLRILSLPALLAVSLSATTIQYQVMTNGAGGTYQYSVSGFVGQQSCPANQSLQCNNEIDNLFDTPLFSQLSNGVAPAGFDLLLFQPNNPPQAAGDYSALALVSNPSQAGPFSVDFTFNPNVGTPGSQTFFIESFDGNGMFQGFAEPAQVTTPRVSGVPEPASFLPCGFVLIMGVVFWARRALA